jgi:CspA family cold shock protein
MKDQGMARQTQTVTCQRCGTGFVLTRSYLDLLSRRNIKVIDPVLCPTCFLRKGPQPKERGQVKWFSPRKHYGFIVSEEGQELFFHERQVLAESGGEPHGGQPVRFHVHHALKGPEALNVEVLQE